MVTPITDLKLLQNSLLSNPEIEAKAKKQEEVIITVGMLRKNLADFPESLSVFADETTIFRFLLIDGTVQGMTLKLYIDDDDEQIKIFDAGNPIQPISEQDLKYVKYKSGINGYQWVQAATSSEAMVIAIPLSLNPEYEQQLKDSNYDPDLVEEKPGLVPAHFLKYRPRPTVKIKDLKEKAEYRVLEYLGTSKSYSGSKRYRMVEFRGTQALGEPFEVYANTSLSKILERTSLPVNVVVTGKKPNPKGEGVIVSFALAKLAQLKV